MNTGDAPAWLEISCGAQRGRKFLLALMVSMVVSDPALAATVNVTATGTFSAYSDPGGLLPFDQPAPGTIFTLTFQYDDQAGDLASADASAGLYINASHSATLSFGSKLFVSTGNSSIIVLNDALNQESLNYGDLWQNFQRVSTTATTEDSIGLVLLSVSATTPVTPLTSDALVPPFGPAGWDTTAAIRYRVIETPAVGDPFIAAYAQATLDSVSVSAVPLPPSIWLLAAAMGLAARYRNPARCLI